MVHSGRGNPVRVLSLRYSVDFVIFAKAPDGKLRTGYGLGSSLAPQKKKGAPKPKLLRLLIRDADEGALNRDFLIFSLIEDANAGGEGDSGDDSDPNLSDDSDGGCGGGRKGTAVHKAPTKKKKKKKAEAVSDAERSKAYRRRVKEERGEEETRKREAKAASTRHSREQNPETENERKRKRKKEEHAENGGRKRPR